MNRIILFLAVLFSCSRANSQTLTAANYTPVLGEYFPYWAHGIPTLVPGPSGTNQNWDFSYVKGNNQYSSYLAVAGSQMSQYPAADFVIQNLNSQQLVESYYDITNSGIEIMGSVYNTTTSPLPNPVLELPLPLTMGTNTSFTMGSGSSAVTYSYAADATGTLITCFKTYTNAIRVHEVITWGVVNMTDSYVWYVPGVHREVFRIRTVTNGQNVSGPLGITLEDQSIYVNTKEQVSSLLTNIYPNPFTDYLKIIMADEIGPDHEVKLLSLEGSMLRTIKPDFSEDKMELRDLPTGIYILQLQKGKVVLDRKKVIKL